MRDGQTLRTNEHSGRQIPRPAALILVAASFFALLFFVSYFVYVARTPSLRQNVAGDFPQWVAAVRLLRTQPGRLYDLEAQRREYSDFQQSLQRSGLAPPNTTVSPAAGASNAGPYFFLYPPFVAALFLPIVAAPFPLSFLIWAGLSALFYGCAIALTAPSPDRFVAVWLAFASPLFLWYTVVYGQLSALACIAIAGGVFLERRGAYFFSGVLLGFCAYKPTLLVWIIPMLLVSGRFRALLGMASTGSVLAALSLAVAGWRGCLDWVRILFRWSNHVSAGGPNYPLAKFVDLNACTKLLGPHSKPAIPALAAIAAIVCLVIAVRAWRGPLEGRWATTLTLTLLVNLYAPIYDALLLVIAILLTWRAGTTRACALFLVVLHLAAWWSETLTRRGWPPPVTLVAFGFMLFQWYLLRRVKRSEAATTSVAVAGGVA